MADDELTVLIVISVNILHCGQCFCLYFVRALIWLDQGWTIVFCFLSLVCFCSGFSANAFVWLASTDYFFVSVIGVTFLASSWLG